MVFDVIGVVIGVGNVLLCAGDEVEGRVFNGVEDSVGTGRDATVAYEG